MAVCSDAEAVSRYGVEQAFRPAVSAQKITSFSR